MPDWRLAASRPQTEEGADGATLGKTLRILECQHEGERRDGTDSVDLAQRAVEQGVGIVPGTLFFPDGRGADTVRLSFSLVDEALVDDGIERLASLL